MSDFGFGVTDDMITTGHLTVITRESLDAFRLQHAEVLSMKR